MILYVVIERRKEYLENNNWLNHARRLEEAADDHCLILHCTEVTDELLAEVRPWAVCHSGGAYYDEKEVTNSRPYRELVMNYPAAQIGFCGGHQTLAHLHGATLAPMRRLRRDEPEQPGYAPGMFKEWGIYPVKVVRKDPLFAGLGRMIHVQEFHAWEIRKLGRKLKLLARSADCRVQAYVHRKKPLYGTQFHPEQSPDGYPDGNTVLKNFFAVARKWQRKT